MSGDVMSFPDNWWTFVQDYQFADKEEIYTNGSMLIPSFRVRQMVEHYFGGKVGKTSQWTCKVEGDYWHDHGGDGSDTYELVLSCGHRVEWLDGDEKPRYCPSCGARIEVGE